MSDHLSRVLPKDMQRANAVSRSMDTRDSRDRRPSAPAPAVRQPWVPWPALRVERWKGGLKAAFELFAPQAVYIAAPERPVSVALLEPRQDDHGGWHVRIAKRPDGRDDWRGGNPFRWQRAGSEWDREDWTEGKGCFPVRVGLTGAQPDRVALPRDPYVPWAVRRRVWTLGLDDSDAALELEALVKTLLIEARVPVNPEPMPWGYIDAGWRFDAAWFESECLIPAAKRLKLWVRSEAGMEAFLRRGMDLSRQRYRGAARRYFHGVCLEMIEKELEARSSRGVFDPAYPLNIFGELRDYSVTPEHERQVEAIRRAKGLAG